MKAVAIKSATKRGFHLLARVLVATLAGGSLFGACDMRFRDAFVDGTKIFISQELSDLGTNIANCITDDESCSL